MGVSDWNTAIIEQFRAQGGKGVAQFGDALLLLPLLAPIDVILANIVSSVHLDLLPEMARALRPGGRAVLSGILIEEREMMQGRLSSTGWVVIDEDIEDIWWSATISRR